MLTPDEKKELQDAIKDTLKTLGDLTDIEKRVLALKKKLDKIYFSIDEKLDKGKF